MRTRTQRLLARCVPEKGPCASCVSCLPPPNSCPPAPARATSCSDPLGCALRRLEPEAWNHRGECSRTQRIMPAASADGGARGGVWSLQHERGAPAPAPRMPARAPLRSTIGVQASPHVALGWQDSAQSSHPPKREFTQEQLERAEGNRQKALATRQATELHGLLRNSSQCVACKE